MPWEELVVILAVAAVASTVQTIAGFGFALLAVPLMSLGVDTRTSVLVASLLGFVNNVVQFSGGWGDAERPVARRLVTGAYLGMPVGLAFLVTADATVLRLAVGVVVLAFTAILARGLDLSGTGPSVDWAAGFVSGVLNTSISTNGPPLVIVLHGRGLAPHVFRATVSVVFVMSGALALVLFTVAGQWNRASLVGSIAALPMLALGGSAGRAIRPHVDARGFRTVVLALLAVSGLAALTSALADLS